MASYVVISIVHFVTKTHLTPFYSLNSRKSLRGDLFDSTNASQDGFDLKKVVGRRGGSASGPLNIKVETQTVQYNDSEINEVSKFLLGSATHNVSCVTKFFTVPRSPLVWK